jgi:hypothetical protein
VRHLYFAAAVAASILAWTLPLVLVGRYENWWWLMSCAVTVPACEACWLAHDRLGPPGG